MYSARTKDIIISVSPRYESMHSDPGRSHYVFSYSVIIKNKGHQSVQLLKRHWVIKSADGIIRDVEGEGVVGQQPLLHPGESFKYSSWAPITCEIGEMRGEFLMKNIESQEFFKVMIPKFQFITDPLLN